MDVFIFQAKNDKSYPGAGEDAARKLNFLKVDALIQANNNDPNSSYVMVHNKFSDLVSLFFSASSSE